MPRWYTGRDVARPAYYDREAIPCLGFSNVGVGPHANIIRVSYGPAFPYAAFIETMITTLQRNVAAAPVGLVNAYWELVPFFGGSTIIDSEAFTDNTVGYRLNQVISQLGYMAYGDLLQFRTFDLGTGGSVGYLGSFKGTEFLY